MASCRRSDTSQALERDIEAQAEALAGRPLVSIFLGGGTPSLFGAGSDCASPRGRTQAFRCRREDRSHDGGQPRSHRARPLRGICSRWHHSRVAWRAEFRCARSSGVGSNSLARRDGACGRRTARRGPGQFQSRSDVRAARTDNRGRGERRGPRTRAAAGAPVALPIDDRGRDRVRGISARPAGRRRGRHDAVAMPRAIVCRPGSPSTKFRPIRVPGASVGTISTTGLSATTSGSALARTAS